MSKVFKYIKDAEKIVGGLSNTDKMSSLSYNIPPTECRVGSMLMLLRNSVCSSCYARKQRYTMPNTTNAMKRRYKSLSNPDWVDAMIYLIKNKKIGGKNLTHFRWHDAGDIQDMLHLNNICEVARATSNVKHWLPTKEYIIIKMFHEQGNKIPRNLNIRLSGYMINAKPPRDFAKDMHCTTSSVESKEKFGSNKLKSNVNCPIYMNKDMKNCGDCEACYLKSVKSVTYRKH